MSKRTADIPMPIDLLANLLVDVIQQWVTASQADTKRTSELLWRTATRKKQEDALAFFCHRVGNDQPKP